MADSRPSASRREGRELGVLDMDRQCSATAKGTGLRCGRTVPLGHVVCKWHGGNAPQAKEKAKLRLLELVEPAVAQLARTMVSSDDERLRLRAVENVLDRAGLPRGMKIDGQDAKAVLVERLTAYRVEAGIDPAGDSGS